MRHSSLYALAALAVTGLSGLTVHVRAQLSDVQWSAIDQGFAASASGNANSIVLSTIGQSFVGAIRNSDNTIESGFLVDALLRGSITGFGEDGETGVPLTYDLSQNYPNPFNPSTLIRFTIPERSLVSLKVYDVIGREVASLVDEERAPGVYEVRFDAKGLSTGAYFYRLIAGSYVRLRKLLILK